MLNDPEPTYPEILAEITEALTKHKVSSRTKDLWTTLHPLLLSNMTQNGCSLTFQNELEAQFKKLTYASSKEEGPYCSKRIQKYFTCYNCSTNANDKDSGCFCSDCFSIDKHAGHNFRLIQTTKLAVCDCGDINKFDRKSFCNKHRERKRKEPAIDPQKEQEFVKEMKFLLSILINLSHVKADFTDDTKKKQLFATAFMKKIAQFIDQSYPNKVMAAHLFASQMCTITIGKGMKHYQKKTVLQSCTFQRIAKYFQKLSEMVLLPLYTVKEMRELVINESFGQITSDKYFMTTRSPLAFTFFQYVNAQEEVVRALTRMGPLIIKYNFAFPVNKCQAYMQLLNLYFLLLVGPKTSEMLILLLKGLDISQLADYYSPKLQKTQRITFYTLETVYFEVIVLLIKGIIQIGQKEYLMTIMKDCFKCIKKKAPSPSFSVERTFALALFAFVGYDLEEIFDLQEETMLLIFGEENEEQTVHTIEAALRKAFTPLKMDNISDLRRHIYCSKDHKNPHLMFSADHIYLKALLNFLMRLQQRSSTYLLQPLASYIDSRTRSLNILFDLYQTEQVGKLEQAIEMYFYELASVMAHLIYLSQTTLYQLIVTCALEPTRLSKQSAFEFFEFIVYVYDPPSVKEFRAQVIKYLRNDTLIQQFVKTAYSRYKVMVGQGVVPKNNFNISFNSLYLQFKSFKEFASMYELKLRKYCRTQLSRLIFSMEMLDRLYDVFSRIFDIFLKHFRSNELPNSKLIMNSAVESTILLALETKDTRFDELALNFIEKYYPPFNTTIPNGNSQEEYGRNLVLMYTRSQKQLNEERTQIVPKSTFDDASKKMREKAAMKMKKINQIKEKQRSFIANNINSAEDLSENRKTEHICTICKDITKVDGLYYLCHTRFSNFIKSTKRNSKQERKEIQAPILVISTCGHTVHLACLKQSVQIIDDVEFDFDCFLCKGYSNSIFPIISNMQQSNRIAETFLPKQIALLFSIMQENPFLARQIDVESFDIHEMLINSIVDCIYWYGVQFPKYFVTKILPVIRQLIRLMTSLPEMPLKLAMLIDKLEKLLGKQLDLLKCKEELWLIKVRAIIMRIIYRPTLDNLQVFLMILQNILLTDLIGKTELDIMLIILKEVESNEPLDSYELVTKYQLKDSQQAFLQLPKDLLELNAEIGKCPKCHKITSKMLLCFACGFKICENCSSTVKKHVQSHLYTCIFIRVEVGDCFFYFEGDRVAVSTLYLDYAGEALQSASSFPQKGNFMLSPECLNELCNILMNDHVKMEFRLKKHPARCEVQ